MGQGMRNGPLDGTLVPNTRLACSSALGLGARITLLPLLTVIKYAIKQKPVTVLYSFDLFLADVIRMKTFQHPSVMLLASSSSGW